MPTYVRENTVDPAPGGDSVKQAVLKVDDDVTNVYTALNTLDTGKLPTSYLDTDGTLAANSDVKIASQKAVKTYAVPLTYLDTDVTLAANSDTKIATQKATKALIAATAFSTALPAQDISSAGKLVTTDGTDASWTAIKTVNNISLLGAGNIDAKVANIVTATTATTLTSTPTLLQITPAGYGVAVTLPDATTCAEGGPLHIIDNKGAYPVRVLDSTGVLKAFIYGGVVSHISLIDNSTAAGTWTIENGERTGASAQLLTSSLNTIVDGGVVALDADREFILGAYTNNLTGVVYNKATNTFGNVTVIRSVSGVSATFARCVVSGTDQVLIVSTNGGSTAFEAVAVSISGTTITVNTAATATLSANITAWGDGCGVIAIPGAAGSFVVSYTVATPAAQIRAISISGTTVTIGNATVLDGTDSLIVAASGDKVIAATTATTHLYTKPYTVSGSTLSPGTGTDTNSGAMGLYKFAPLGSRWAILYNDAGVIKGGIVSLSGTTTTISVATLFSSGVLSDAIIVSGKILALNNQTTNNANILTDTAGTASGGTAITLSAAGSRACGYADGTSAVVFETGTNPEVAIVSCSGASPVLTRLFKSSSLTNVGLSFVNTASNGLLTRPATRLHGSRFVGHFLNTGTSSFNALAALNENAIIIPSAGTQALSGNIAYRGKLDSERWIADASTVITKVECAL